MPVRTSDLQICEETATGVDITGQFQLKDLVNTLADKIGVVVHIGKERLHVLNMDGKVEISPVQSVTQNNNLNVGDIINVIDESLANHQGQIKHLYHHFVSIFCSVLVENGRLFVSKARNLLLADERSKISSIRINALYISLRTMLTPSPHTSSTGALKKKKSGSSLIHSNSPASSGGGGRTLNSTEGGETDHLNS